MTYIYAKNLFSLRAFFPSSATHNDNAIREMQNVLIISITIWKGVIYSHIMCMQVTDKVTTLPNITSIKYQRHCPAPVPSPCGVWCGWQGQLASINLPAELLQCGPLILLFMFATVLCKCALDGNGWPRQLTHILCKILNSFLFTRNCVMLQCCTRRKYCIVSRIARHALRTLCVCARSLRHEQEKIENMLCVSAL